MARTPDRQSSSATQNDPGESNNPRSSAGDFDTHIWTSLNQIFERLGGMSEKIDGLTEQQKSLKASVEKHDKIILRTTFSVTGAIAIIVALWFLYENFLKDHVSFK